MLLIQQYHKRVTASPGDGRQRCPASSVLCIRLIWLHMADVQQGGPVPLVTPFMPFVTLLTCTMDQEARMMIKHVQPPAPCRIDWR